jgi:hypothetical protein
MARSTTQRAKPHSCGLDHLATTDAFRSAGTQHLVWKSRDEGEGARTPARAGTSGPTDRADGRRAAQPHPPRDTTDGPESLSNRQSESNDESPELLNNVQTETTCSTDLATDGRTTAEAIGRGSAGASHRTAVGRSKKALARTGMSERLQKTPRSRAQWVVRVLFSHPVPLQPAFAGSRSKEKAPRSGLLDRGAGDALGASRMCVFVIVFFCFFFVFVFVVVFVVVVSLCSCARAAQAQLGWASSSVCLSPCASVRQSVRLSLLPSPSSPLRCAWAAASRVRQPCVPLPFPLPFPSPSPLPAASGKGSR